LSFILIVLILPSLPANLPSLDFVHPALASPCELFFFPPAYLSHS
jgi:hypothetical protein